MTSSLAKTLRGATIAGFCVFAVAGTPVPGVAATVTIQMTDNNEFVPKEQTVKVGDTVFWQHVGTHTHTVTPDQTGDFTGSDDLGEGVNYTITVSGSPRTIKYYCKKHGAPGGGGMSGTLVVGP
jgi:plastocyanin